MEYNFIEIEAKWQKYWAEHKTYAAEDFSEKPKFYGLTMFPYPSGAGLHVGHPLGYIASCIYARYMKLLGYNVLHPMGYDSFGLPAEQYAIQTGQHPSVTTEQNIARYREQLDKLGFSFDWDREVRTSDPSYYKWTQWIFKQLFNSWYDNDADKARPIANLIKHFESKGNAGINASTDQKENFTADQWKSYNEEKQQAILMNYRLTYLADSWVNWCPALGTVLANDEIKDGVSERGGHPVEQKLMRQWSMRITAYAERLLNDLENIDWTDSIKDQQRNWIGKSVGASVRFEILSPTLSKGKGASDPGYKTGAVESINKNLQRAKDMRAEPTQAEAKLWKELKSKKLDGYKFRQQHPIGHYIVDFVCLQYRLIIEVDGLIHKSQVEEDKQRTLDLEEEGYTIIRFSNEEVLENLDAVLKSIKSELDKLPHIDDKVLPTGKDLGWEKKDIEVFTTRPDTIFGVSFMVLAPEHELVDEITTDEYKSAVAEYKKQASLKTERDRQSDVKNITGQNTGAFAIHPFTGEKVQIWIGDYVLAGYGTGAVMAVPCGDQRDWDFAKHFNIEIINIFKDVDISEEAYAEKDAIIANSDFLDGLDVKSAIKRAIEEIESKGIGKGQTNYRLRNAVFSRQRYWGEPFPVYYKGETPYLIEDDMLPVTLPEVDKYLPTEDGEPPLARANKEDWEVFEGDRMEYSTMPGWAGSSWYFLRYMDPHNEAEFVSRKKVDYWKQVDLYIGGSEHATGHLLYSRFWTKFLFDRGYIGFNEPFKKMINQGMILGRSNFVYRDNESGKYVSFGKRKEYRTSRLHADISLVDNDKLNIEGFKSWNPEYANAEFILEDDGSYICGHEVEKMSKSKFNVQTPDELVEKFGADTLRCYEMFLGPLEQSKPWDTQGINGVHNFLRKFWRLFHDENNEFNVSDGEPSKDSLKTLHKTIKKIKDDLDRFSFNTGVSNFMIATNELTDQKCNNRQVLSELVILLSPYAPHIAEELWEKLGNTETVTKASFPKFNPDFLVENEYAYPVSFNGKMRFKIELPTSLSKEDIEKEVLAAEQAQKWLEGKEPKKVIVVPGKIVNIVI